MVIRMLLRLLSNNEQLVQRLSESYPVRRAAQIVVLFFHRGKHIVEDKALKENLTPQKLRSFIRRFSENLEKELKENQDKFKRPK